MSNSGSVVYNRRRPSLASPAVTGTKDMGVDSSRGRASFDRVEPVSSQLTTIDEITPNECDELSTSFDWRDELLSPETSHELVSTTARESCSGKEVATSTTVTGNYETSKVSPVTTEEYGLKDSEPSTEQCLVTPKTEAAEVAFGSTNTFDWKKELESPGISNRKIRISARDKLTGEAIGGLPIVDFALKTPEVQVAPIFFGSTDTYDWKKEMQSPALYPRSKRRTDSIVVLHEGVSESRIPVSSSQDDSMQLADPRMESWPGAEFQNEGGEKTDLSELPRLDDLVLTGETVYTPADAFDTRAERSDVQAIAEYQAVMTTGDSSPIISQSDDLEAFDSVDVGIVRGSRGTVLATIRENGTASKSIDIEEYRRLLINHQRLQDRLYSMTKNNDDRMTPFRDVFDEVSCTLSWSIHWSVFYRQMTKVVPSGSDENSEWK
jgi:hypothetical protein